MTDHQNKISNFWQELKRRNVVRVVTVYAGAAFVIIELINNITEPLHLPEWTPTLVIVLLAIGFPIVIIFSWIYDVHPEGGIVKTEPAEKVKAEEIPKASNSWKIASYISFVVIVGLIVLNVIPREKHTELNPDLETSIAVLPFENMSDDSSYSHIGGAFTDEIILELQKIKAFSRVLSRTSTMQYEEDRPTIPEIAEKLNVNYIIEGSIQRMEGRVRIRVQVIRANNEDHILGESYDEDYNEPKDILDIQSRIAQSVADKLQVAITPEEKDLINKVPTTNLTAYYYYQRGNEEWRSNRWDSKALVKAEEFFTRALNNDSTYGQAYLGLANIHRQKNISADYLSENYLDSVLMLANKALSFDNTLAEAYLLRGDYYSAHGDREHALKEYDRAMEINPNLQDLYWSKFGFYSNVDQVAVLTNLQKAMTVDRGDYLPISLVYFGRELAQAGFSEIGKTYLQKGYDLNNAIKITRYYADVEALSGNWEESVRLYREYCMADPSDPVRLFELGCFYGFLGQSKESLKFLEKWLDSLDETLYNDNQYDGMHRLGYAYWKNNRFDEAKQYFNLQMEYCNRILGLDLPDVDHYAAYYDKAAIYAFRGEKEKAFESLRRFNQQKTILAWMHQLIKIDPLLENIREEPEFQQIVRDVEAKYLAEHERVRQWLEENDML